MIALNLNVVEQMISVEHVANARQEITLDVDLPDRYSILAFTEDLEFYESHVT